MHVALLRGINVGKAKRVAMADLRALCESLGYRDVKTLLNSGNIVFSAPRADAKAATKIQKGIAEKLGVSCRVIVLTGDELDRVMVENPISEGETTPSRFLITALADASARARIQALMEQEWGSERLGLGTHAAYLWCPDGILESLLVGAIAKELGDAATSRNLTTMQKLQALMRSPAPATPPAHTPPARPRR